MDPNQKENMNITTPILRVDTVNSNGITYPRDVVEGAIATFVSKNRELHLVLDSDAITAPLDLTKIAGTVANVRLVGQLVFADISVLSTPAGGLLEKIAHHCEFVAMGSGAVEAGGIVSEYTLNYVAAVPIGTAAFKTTPDEA